MKATEGGGNIEYVDPKTGKPQANVYFDSAVVTTASGTKGSWHNVHGVMYSGGLPADKFTAPLVTGDNEKQTLTATGGVLITSLTQANTTLRCDRMTWYMSQNKLIGVGHAVFKRGVIIQTTPSFQVDTLMKMLVAPARDLGKKGGHVVHTHIVHTHGAR